MLLDAAVLLAGIGLAYWGHTKKSIVLFLFSVWLSAWVLVKFIWDILKYFSPS